MRKKRGRRGEEIACTYLRKRGYCIAERNFRCKMGEIDIVAIAEDRVCFTEVKARSSLDYGMPRDAVSRSKQQKLLRSAQLWLQLHPLAAQALSPRMDIVEILYLDDGIYVRHTPDAFS